MITNSPQQKKSTLFNESPIQKSIIAQSPFHNESIDVFQKIQTQSAQIQKLNTQLSFYKNESKSKQSGGQIIAKASKSRIKMLQNQISKMSFQNQEQKEMIKKLSQDLRETKRQGYYGDNNLMAECQQLQIENDRFREQNIKKTKQIKELQFQLADMQLTNKRNQELIELQKQELSIKKQEDSPENNRLRNLEMEYKITELNEEINDYMREIDSLNDQIDKLKKENVIDRDSRNRRTFDNLKVAEGSRSRYSVISHSRVSDLQMLDNERLSLKVMQKNKEYGMLYAKYQSLQSQYNSLEEINQELVRQQKMLSQRISNFQIHTQGDQIVGELQTKLVLMSTEMMRLGNLSRTKVQQTKELNIKLKQLILKNEHLQKDMIQKDKMMLNYKEQLRLLQLRMNDMNMEQQKYKESKQSKQKITKLVRETQKITILYKQKLQALKNSDIKNAILQQKNSRLMQQNQDLERENKNLTVGYEKIKSNVATMMNQQAEINYYKETNVSLKEEIKRIEAKVQDNRGEVQRMAREREENRSSSNNAMDRLAAAQEQLRRISIRYEQKEMEIREMSHKSQEKMISKNNQIKKLEERIAFLDRENQRNSRIRTQLPKFEQLLKEIQRLEGGQLSLKLQISNYEEKVALLAQENERLTLVANQRGEEDGQIKKLRLQIDQKDKKLRQFQRDIETLSTRQRRYKQDNEILRLKLRENSTFEREVESMQFKNRQLRDQIQVLKTQITVKEEQLKQFDERYQRECIEKSSLLRVNEELNSKISIPNYSQRESTSRQNLEKELKKYVEKTQKDAMKIKQLSDKNQEHEQIYATFSGQIMRLNQVLGETTEKISSYKKQIDFLQHKVRTCEESLQSRKHIQFGSEKSIGEAENKSKIQIFQGKIRGYESQIDLLKQRINSMKEFHTSQQSKINDLTRQKSRFQNKVSEMEYQLSLKTQNFRTVQDSFKLTILEIKNSNQRLEQSLRQIENHYISKLDSKQNEVNSLRQEKREYEVRIYQLEKKISNLEISYGSEINEKNKYISNLNSNNNQTKEEIETVKKMKNQYEIKLALLSQEIQRLNILKERQASEIQSLRVNLKQNEAKYLQSMKDSSYHSQTTETLSQEIERLNNVILKNVEQIKESQKKTKSLEYECDQLRKENRQQRSKKQSVERRLSDEKDQFSERIMRHEEMNKELRFQFQEKVRECEKLGERTRALEERQQMETNGHMKNLYEEMKLLRESNQKLETKLGAITRQYENSVQQLEYYKKTKASADEDEKMRIIGNYEATIKNMKDENTRMFNERARLQNELQKVNQISYEVQERYKISEEKARTYEQKSKRLEERLKIVEQRLRSQDDLLRGRSTDKSIVEQKMMNVMEQVGRLKLIIKSKDSQIQKLSSEIRENRQSTISKTEYFHQKNTQRKGIYVIKQVSQMEQRSRSASGNNPQGQLKHQPNQSFTDLQHRYELMESVNRKITTELECLRKKNIEYQFKMNKLKEEFDLINRLIHQYREQNQKLKQTNRLLSAQGRSNNLMAAHSQFSSPQHSTSKIGNFQSSISYQRSNVIQSHSRFQKEDSFIQIKSKLVQQIDRLNRVNTSLQGEVHELRLNSSENISLRKRYEQSLAVMTLLFVQIEALRGRVRDNQRSSMSPRK